MKSSRFFGKRFIFSFLAGFTLAFVLLLTFFVLSVVREYQYKTTALFGMLETRGALPDGAVDQLMNGTQGTADYQKGLALLSEEGYGKSGQTIMSHFIASEIIIFLLGAVALLALLYLFFHFYYQNHKRFLRSAKKEVKKIWIKNEAGERPVYYGNADACALLGAIDECAITYRHSLKLVNQEREKVYSFMEDVSHQLKTPLSLIRICAERMELELEPPLQAKMRYCQLQIDRMTSLIRYLLKTGMLDAGRVKMEYRRNSVLLFAQTVTDELMEMAEENEIEINIVCLPGLELYFDEFWMSEALQNILKNCIEHSPKHTQVSLRVVEEYNGCSFHISDCGRGIDQASLNSVFDRFRSGGRRDDHSNGLGLTIARQILKCHFGTLRVQNNEGAGVTFIAHFPHLQGRNTYHDTKWGACSGNFKS